jgi:ribose 5-phosphate isomerase B
METKPFDIIAEADARMLAPGSIVRLAPGGLITPLARDTLRERRITVVHDDGGTPDPDLAPVAEIRQVAIGSDHVGVALKRRLTGWLRGRGLGVEDVGVYESAPADYPDTAAAVARLVSRREVDAGIAIDGAGLGSAIAANKLAGVRAAMCTTEVLARYSREHNGANVLALGATLVTPEEAERIVARFLDTPMLEPRYIARLAKIARLER